MHKNRRNYGDSLVIKVLLEACSQEPRDLPWEVQRICQFRIVKKQPEVKFEEIDNLDGIGRGGFGSTGIT